MTRALQEPIASSLLNELARAVARWEYEGGAGADGPYDGFGAEGPNGAGPGRAQTSRRTIARDGFGARRR